MNTISATPAKLKSWGARLKIHDVRREPRGNRYCGPAAVSAITGCTTTEAAYLFRRCRGMDRVVGTSRCDMQEVLLSFGLSMQSVPASRLADASQMPGVHLVSYNEHWAVVGDGKYVCGRVANGRVISARDDRMPLAIVERCYRIAGVLRTPEYLSQADAYRAERRATKAIRAQCTRIAREIGAEIDIDEHCPETPTPRFIWPAYGAYADEESDPFCDNSVDTWAEALARLIRYRDDQIRTR